MGYGYGAHDRKPPGRTWPDIYLTDLTYVFDALELSKAEIL